MFELVSEKEQKFKITERRYKYKKGENIEEHKQLMKKEGFDRVDWSEDGEWRIMLYRKKEEIE